ncbi:MAG: hypothetical protein CBD69_000195 [Crocinitomicaceae bacterium TMED209]|nr:MAG: hypothetical protein CBD69_000195 [Crocinitomicaceae bacterium TMED209]|tara:strand:- start:159 stop:605 length:447 start_codon:yes stop_codon:yes gene_type:complete
MKKLKETKLGQALKRVAPQVLDVVGGILPDQGALGIVKNLIDKDETIDPATKQMLHEQVVETYKLEVEDRDSAREREVEILKTGSSDWMMNVTGIIGLGSFIFLIYAIVFITVPEHNSELMIHTTGIVEGIVLSIVGYYFGSIARNKQ